MELRLVKATKSEIDAKLIMNWRNDPVTLSMFYNQTPKVWPEFFQEYLNTYFLPNAIQPHFADFQNEKIAFLRSNVYECNEIEGILYDIDINLNPIMRGKGLSSSIISLFSNYIFDQNIDCLIAEIKTHNLASIKSFRKAGFVNYDETIKSIYNKEYKIIRLIKRKSK